MATPLLSIIIPCYNASKTIVDTLQCFKSELNDLPAGAFEILIVNDGSTDATADIIKSSSYPAIKYFEKPNGGVGSARNFGLCKASGKYIWFFDADDQLFRGG